MKFEKLNIYYEYYYKINTMKFFDSMKILTLPNFCIIQIRTLRFEIFKV